jgi:hypothetical protein
MEETTLLRLSRRSLLRSGLLWMSSNLLTKRVSFAEQPAASTGAAQKWTIGNDHIERTISYAAAGLRTERLSDLSTQVDFIAPDKLRLDMAREFAQRKKNTAGRSNWRPAGSARL